MAEIESDSLSDHVESCPKEEICLFSSGNVFLHIPAQYSATKEEIQVRGTLKLAHKNKIRVQWFPTNINTEDLLCLYSHDPSDDWEDLISDLNATDFPNGDIHTASTNSSGGKSGSFMKEPHTPNRTTAREMSIPAANGDPTMFIRVKTETLQSNNRSPKAPLTQGFVNIMATPMYDSEGINSSVEPPISYSQTNVSNYLVATENISKSKSAHIFSINQPHSQDTTLDNAIAKLGDYSDLDTDAVFLERDQAKIPEMKSIIVDFPLTMLFSVKEVPCKNNGDSKSHPAIRFNLRGSKPTQNLYFHSGKSTMLKFFHELEQHILLHRHDEDPTLLMTEGEDFVGNCKKRYNEPKTYLQIGISKATDIVSDISNLPRFKALMNFPFPKTSPVNPSPNRVLIPKQEETLVENNLTEVTKSISFLEKPNFDPMPLLQSIVSRKRGQPLNREDWELFCNRDGSITDPTAIKRIVFNGGITKDLRPLVWQYLLGYYEFSHSDIDRQKFISEKENEYQVMKSQWKTMTTVQIQKNKLFHKAQNIIVKDVVRTDRDHPYFNGESNLHLDSLQNILLTHIMYDFDLGYVQGMSDILSPILIVLDREEDAFWCFAQYLEKLHENFANTTQVLETKMNKFKDLLKFVDPPFCAYLRNNEAYGFNIFFRWLLVDFKREFNIDDVCKLWEVLWTEFLTPDYSLFIALSMLLQMRNQIMEQELEDSNFSPFDNVFKMINDAAGEFDIDTTLLLAEALFNKLFNCPNLPQDIISFFPNYRHPKLYAEMSPIGLDIEYSPDTNLDVAEYHFA